MPYRSSAQRKFFHTPTAKAAGITSAQVTEFDKASKGKKMPMHVGQAMKKKMAGEHPHGMMMPGKGKR